jgi:hypothetical protein
MVEDHHSPEWGGVGGDEDAVVSPSIHAGEGARGVPAEAVSYQPFPVPQRLELADD